MEKLKKRSEQEKNDCWDLSVIVKNEQDYQEKTENGKNFN